MNHLLTVCILSISALILCYKGFSKDTQKQTYLWLFFAIFIVDQLLTRLPRMIPALNLLGGEYNWTGKILSTAVAVILVFILKKRYPLNFAFTFRQAPHSLKAILTVVITFTIIQSTYFWFTIAPAVNTWEDFFFQATLPGLSEEIVFRGLLLGLLNGVFENKRKILGADMGWGTVVTALLFALWHGISFNSEMQFQIKLLPMVFPLLGGFMFAWILERSKSLLIPVIYHNLMNEIVQIVQSLK